MRRTILVKVKTAGLPPRRMISPKNKQNGPIFARMRQF